MPVMSAVFLLFSMVGAARHHHSTNLPRSTRPNVSLLPALWAAPEAFEPARAAGGAPPTENGDFKSRFPGVKSMDASRPVFRRAGRHGRFVARRHIRFAPDLQRNDRLLPDVGDRMADARDGIHAR